MNHGYSTTTIQDHSKKRAKVEERENGVGIRKLPSCVEVKKGKFRARIRHPILKARVSLGTFDTPEEASAAVQNVKAQFGYTKRKLPSCVEEKKGRFRARIRHPMLKIRVSLGYYDTAEEASAAVQRKREEFDKEFGYENKLRANHSDNGKESADSCGEREELHVGVRSTTIWGVGCLVHSGETIKEGANAGERQMAKTDNDGVVGTLQEPEGGFDQILIGSKKSAKTDNDRVLVNPERPSFEFDHVVCPTSLFEAENSREKELFESKKRARTDNDSFSDNLERPECVLDRVGPQTSVFEAENSRNDRVLDNPEKPGCGFDNVGSQTSVFEAENLREELFQPSKRVNADNDRVLDNPERPKCGFGHIGSPISAVKAETLSDEPISTSTSFEECMRLGIINQYGQLLGEYSKLDDTLWFDNHLKK